MELPTRRLLLREFREDDVAAVLAYQSKPRFSRFYAWSRRTEANASAMVRRFISWQQAPARRKVQLAITREGVLIGNVGLRRSSARVRVAELGFELDPDEWGNGYTTEAASALLGWGFDQLGLHRVGAHCIAEIEASARVLQRLGMRLEGRSRENHYFKKRWWDTLHFGVLEDEWLARATHEPTGSGLGG
jgi:[ribosomal protein S5]-alanine N-acetyltransferase